MAIYPQKSAQRMTSGASCKRLTLASLVDEFLITHQSEQHSSKTLEWHRTSLGLLVQLLTGLGITDPLLLEVGHVRRTHCLNRVV